MSHLLTDDFSRLQNQRHIPATTWHHWCNLLKLDPIDAIDVLEEELPPHHGGYAQNPRSPLYTADAGGAIGLGYFRLQRGSTQSPSRYHFSLCAERRAVDQGLDQKTRWANSTARFVFTEISRRFICGNIGSQGFTGP